MNKKHRGEDPQERSAFAPYWYVDDMTDSFIEIKNHLEVSLAVVPTLRLITGKSLQLDPITIAPRATGRLSLKSQLQPRSRGRKAEGYWGDGTRSHSLLGSAQLTLGSPRDATARAFSAWVFIKAPAEGLGLVVPFQVPADVINTVFEALWWLPYPETRVYFALQNTTHVSATLRMEMFSQGQIIKTKTLRLGASATRLIDIRALLLPEQCPELGGITFTYSRARPAHKSQADRIHAGQILTRGMLIEEKRGFSSPLMAYGSLVNIPRGVPSEVRAPELQAPIAYFGMLERLLKGSQAYLHPHLLLRNTAKHERMVQGIVYGRDRHGESTTFQLEPMTLLPQSLLHLDLEEQRHRTKSPLADGVAGLRLMHNGAITDIVAEIINVDETGDVVWYDRFRNLWLHETARQTAISFNLEPGSQTFLILKNVADTPQHSQVLLHYDHGKRQYEMEVSKIPPQQVETIDIKWLRDSGTLDKHGQRLPTDVTFGGMNIYSEPGAFVCSDPTFFSATPISSTEAVLPGLLPQPGSGIGSCVSDTDGPPPQGHTYPRSPFSAASGQCFYNAQQPCNASHSALDLGVRGLQIGEPVLAMESGTVVGLSTGHRNGDTRSNFVVVQGSDSFLTVYGHVTPLQDPQLQLGQHVDPGQVLGTVDDSGPSEGPHVHIARFRPPPPGVHPGSEMVDYAATNDAFNTGICPLQIDNCMPG